jgi:MFS family permease
MCTCVGDQSSQSPKVDRFATKNYQTFFSKLSIMFELFFRSALKAGFQDSVITNLVVSSLWSASFNLGACVGPTVAGFMTDAWGFRKASLAFFLMYFTMICVNIAQVCYEKLKAVTMGSGTLNNSNL